MGPRKNDMEKDPHVLDGDFGGFQNGASYVDLQVFYAHQLDFTTGKQPFLGFLNSYFPKNFLNEVFQPIRFHSGGSKTTVKIL